MTPINPAARANVHLIDHPLVQHKLTLMRNKEASTNSFRRLLGELSSLMAYEVCRDMAVQDVEIETPLERMNGQQIGQAPRIQERLGCAIAADRIHRVSGIAQQGDAALRPARQRIAVAHRVLKERAARPDQRRDIHLRQVQPAGMDHHLGELPFV
jgi:hypothetical protein